MAKEPTPSTIIPEVDVPDVIPEGMTDMLLETETELEIIEQSSEDALILGIETSCDETGVAILSGSNQVLANVISSSADLHSRYGGVVPEVASRAHVQAMNPAIAEALREADVTLWDLSAVAVTIGPGLIGSLVVGVAAAKALSSVLEVPLLGINHLEAHIYANFLEHPDFAPPAVGLIVSGGHTLLVHMPAHGLYEVLGETLDDAAGEAFDKVARYLGIGFPGGPAIDQMALGGNRRAIKFPRAMQGRGYDFSFSGLKTSVRDYIRKQEETGTEINLADVCASFQEAVVDVQVSKTIKAAQEYGVSNVFVSGGVAANSRLRELMGVMCEESELRLYYPSPVYCTDNAAMVACCGHFRFRRGIRTDPNIDPDPNLHLA
ncbi:MAG TPA: tRNA (adenosine(37)-N6)-threonylcarbamoyltransferase complex transferase subunit TsaD [Actinomycetota bacterium]|nr:tRNA (adenosine(37)-N6)-threonylcarbamoyltransferase complex transferase subunit TsaD [Actinomycetota bacterium]